MEYISVGVPLKDCVSAGLYNDKGIGKEVPNFSIYAVIGPLFVKS